MKNLWLAVTPDEYELPICVEDTAQELANRFGVKKNTIESIVCKGRSGKYSGRKFIKVAIDEREE
jgi:hypothetical protein